MQLIDQEKVYQRACVGCTRHGEAPGECHHDEPCERLIFEFTTAEPVDAAEVVRCKDCDDWQEHGEFRICEHFSSVDLPGLCKNILFPTRPDDYCSFGRRTIRPETETEETQ